MRAELPSGLPLNAVFVELSEMVHRAGLCLTVGGGYGLYLKHLLVQGETLRTAVPEVAFIGRTTEDIDLFLSIEVLADADQARALREILLSLGFRDREGAKHYQFEKPVDEQGRLIVRVDLETGPVPVAYQNQVRVRRNDRRVCPKEPGIHLHAHGNPAAIGLEHTLEITVAAEDMAGHSVTVPVALPTPFSYVVMKTIAYHDKLTLPAGEFDNAAKHAWDLLRIAAMTTEEDLSISRQMKRKFARERVCEQAVAILDRDFRNVDARGTLRALSQASQRPGEEALNRCLRMLRELVVPE